MEEGTKRRVRELFREYYKGFTSFPERFYQREFGIGDFGKKIYKRHLSFFGEDEFRSFLVKEAPIFVSHSAAFYKDPSATPMEKKGLLGVEMVFDIDTSIKELGKAKEEVFKLWDILKGDFGVKKLSLNFSGKRGFHIHVRDERFFSLGKEERKEILSYILGDVDLTLFFYYDGINILGPKLSEGGLRGRLARAVFLNAKKFGLREEVAERLLRKGVYTPFARSRGSLEDRLKPIVKVVRESVPNVNVDGGVTYDLSKLVRMPDSLHGETGWVAKSIRIEELEEFEPWRDAVAFEGKEKVFLLEEVKIGRKRLKRGEKYTLPTSLAVFLCLQGGAELL